MTGKVRQGAKKMGDALSDELGEGFSDGKQAAKDMVSSIKDVASQVLTLGGAFSAGALVVSAAKAQKANIALANSLSQVHGRFVQVGEVQQIVESAAGKSGSALEGVREELALMSAVADKADVEELLVRSAQLTNRMGLEAGKTGEIFSRVLASGIASSAKEAENVTERIGMMARQTLGLSLDEAFDPNDIMEFIAFMKRGNIELDAAMNLFGLMEGVTKDFGKGVEFVEELGDALNDVKELEAIREASGLTLKQLNANKSVAENFVTVLGKGPKAIKALTDALGFQAREGLENLLGTEFLDRAVSGKGKIAKGDIEAAQDKVREIFSKEAKFKVDEVSNAKRNAELADTQARKFQDAMNKMETVFQSEKVSNAIDKIAERLPDIVEPIADVVTMIVDNPWKSLAAVVGGKLTMAFAGPIITGAVTKGVGALFASMASVQAASAATAATAAASAGGATSALGLSGAAGAGVAGVAAATGAAVLAGGAVGVGAGLAAGEALGIEEQQDAEFAAIRGATTDISAAERLGGPDADFLKVDAAIKSLQRSKSAMENTAMGGGFAVLAGAASLATGMQSPAEMREENISKADEQIKRLTDVLARLGDGAQRAGDKMFDVGGGGGGGLSRGIPHTEQVWGPDSIGG